MFKASAGYQVSLGINSFMNETEWLHDVLDRMREDILEIKQDIRDLREFKFRLLGGVFVITSVLTLAIDGIIFLVKG